MTRLSILLILALTLASCSMVPTPTVPTFSSLDEVGIWINGTTETPGHIAYAWDPLRGAWDAWQTPEETLARGKGDCEDMSLLWLYLINESFGEKGELVICAAPDGFHVCARLGEDYFYRREGDYGFSVISYDDAMRTAQVKSIKE